MAKSYMVTYERDEAGWWVAEVAGVEGCYTQGKSIEQARNRIREALALFIGEAAALKAALSDDIRLDTSAQAAVKRYEEAQAAEQRARDEAARERALVARTLAAARYSFRDIGSFLNVSHQYVAQLAGKTKARTKPSLKARVAAAPAPRKPGRKAFTSKPAPARRAKSKPMKKVVARRTPARKAAAGKAARPKKS